MGKKKPRTCPGRGQAVASLHHPSEAVRVHERDIVVETIEVGGGLRGRLRRLLLGWSPSLKRKVIGGGSFKDVGLYLQTGTRCFEYQDTAKCYIGFRSVLTYLGRGNAVNAEDL